MRANPPLRWPLPRPPPSGHHLNCRDTFSSRLSRNSHPVCRAIAVIVCFMIITLLRFQERRYSPTNRTVPKLRHPSLDTYAAPSKILQLNVLNMCVDLRIYDVIFINSTIYTSSWQAPCADLSPMDCSPCVRVRCRYPPGMLIRWWEPRRRTTTQGGRTRRCAGGRARTDRPVRLYPLVRTLHGLPRHTDAPSGYGFVSSKPSRTGDEIRTSEAGDFVEDLAMSNSGVENTTE